MNLFEASFAEHYPGEVQPMARDEGDALMRYGANMLPVDYEPTRPSSPIVNYPYGRTREALHQLSRNGPPHNCHGDKMRYVNPATGGYPMPTIAAFMQLLPKGFNGKTHRSTDATVYSIVEGNGRPRVGETFAWGPRDIFFAPSWMPVAHEAEQDAVVSRRPEGLGPVARAGPVQ